MKSSQPQALADSIAAMLVSYGAHGLATHSLEGMGEITLRDGLIVAAAAVAAEAKQAWVLEREITPKGWSDATVDMMISCKGNNNRPKQIAGVELKWWRATDGGNAANRRRDLLKDFLRAAAMYTLVEDLALVALLSTAGSWSATASTNGSDSIVMSKLSKPKKEKWDLSLLTRSAALKIAMKALSKHVPVCNIFHTELLSDYAVTERGKQVAFARVWAVRKPQNTKFLSATEINRLTQ